MAAPDSHIDQDFVDAVRKDLAAAATLEWYLPGFRPGAAFREAYQYYLPAYLFALIDAPRTAPTLVPSLIAWPEGLLRLPSQRSRWEERMPLLP